MASELSPGWTNARMTKAQIRKYLADMKKAQAIAEQKLKHAENSWELEKEQKELEALEDLLE